MNPLVKTKKRKERESARPRYSARVQTPKGMKEVGFGTLLSKEIARVKRYHAKHGYAGYVWDVHTGKSIPESEIAARVDASEGVQ